MKRSPFEKNHNHDSVFRIVVVIKKVSHILFLVMIQFGLVSGIYGCGKHTSTFQRDSIIATRPPNLNGLSTATFTTLPESSIFVLPITTTPGVDGGYPSGEKLLFSDEFSGDSLNTVYWDTQYDWGRVDMEEGSYLSPDAFEFSDGILRIRADNKPVGERLYTAGAISSHGRFEFRYGYVEMRAKLPAGQGFWTALWLLTADSEAYDEIDIVELLGNDPYTAYMTLHYQDAATQDVASKQTKYVGPDFSDDYHVFAVDWQADYLAWFVDGVKRVEITENIPKDPMFIIVTFAVGGEWPGYPDVTTPFPAYLDLDYIRIYYP